MNERSPKLFETKMEDFVPFFQILTNIKRRDESPPHIFAVAERAWVNMGEERENQSILITYVLIPMAQVLI